MDRPTRIAELPNLGQASERMLAGVGIRTVADLERTGAVEAYRLLRDAGTPGLSRTMLWALLGALEGLDWRQLPDGLRRAALDRLAEE